MNTFESTFTAYRDRLPHVAEADIAHLNEKDRAYGGSWKRRGGVGAFMMLARKWDRIEEYLKGKGWDVFEAAERDDRPEGLRQDLGDLRRYLMLVEAELEARAQARKDEAI